MPDADTAAFETAIQRHVHRCGLSVTTIRAADGPTDELDRAWTLMDLARAAADLHRCPTDGQDLDGHDDRADIRAFLARLATQADSIDRHDLADTARILTEHAPTGRVICHGDLHPFNLLVNEDQWTILDWSTAVIADPHYDLGFTTLMLANPPLGGPAPVRALARRIGHRLAQRFLHTYTQHSGTPIDLERLAWGHAVHALRAVVEIATWQAHQQLNARAGHPWLLMGSTLEKILACSGDRAIWISIGLVDPVPPGLWETQQGRVAAPSRQPMNVRHSPLG